MLLLQSSNTAERGVTANILGLGPSDSGFESRRSERKKLIYELLSGFEKVEHIHRHSCGGGYETCTVRVAEESRR